VSIYTIGEAAERTGFSASTLRYYESIGLVSAVQRTAAGYRTYDDSALAKVSFIARAKGLGCTLDEITDLISVWDDDECEPVQRRLHELVTAKIADAQGRAAELVAFTSQLQGAAARLGAPAGDGACDEGCACMSDGAAANQAANATPTANANPTGSTPVTLIPGRPEIACTLDASAMPGRVDDWRALLARASARESLPDGGLRIGFDDRVAIDEIARLAAAEQGCCAFFSFAITVDAQGTALEVRAPEGAADVVSALFGGS
jgi:DNA-binding transcriptional MerR regulator